jgi:DNA invertase Pin-like site-specific DNA recombinase
MEKETVKAVEVVRVSSNKQRIIGESHENQDEIIRNRVIQIEAQVGKTIKVVKSFKFSESASGELDMQPIAEAIDYCKSTNGEIKYLFVKCIDRFTRAGSTVYDQLKSQLTRYGVQLIDAYGVISTQRGKL